MGSDQPYTSLVKKLFIKLIAIVGLIANKASRRIAYKTSVDRCSFRQIFTERSCS